MVFLVRLVALLCLLSILAFASAVIYTERTRRPVGVRLGRWGIAFIVKPLPAARGVPPRLPFPVLGMRLRFAVNVDEVQVRVYGPP